MAKRLTSSSTASGGADDFGNASTADSMIVDGTSIVSMTAGSKTAGQRCGGGACCSRHGSIIRRSPSVVYAPLGVFALFLAAGLAVILTTASSERTVAEQEAISQAEETGRWFSNQLEKALAPVFSIAQFATEIEEFQNLPEVVASLPFRPTPTIDNLPTNRDISGSALESPLVVERYNRIASVIKERANLPGILIQLQLAPKGVLSLIYPLNNTEDFPEGIYLDSSNALGLDLLNHPHLKPAYEKSLEQEFSMEVIGPLPLIECSDDNECHPTVTQALFARLPISSPTHQIKISNGQIYQSWGFAFGLINWAELVRRSALFESFAAKGREFRLTKQTVRCASEESCTKSTVELAKTPGFDDASSGRLLAVTIDLDTTTDEWQMTVAYPDPTDQWLPWAITAIVFIALCMGMLVYYIMYQKQVQADLAEKSKQTQKKIASLERKKLDMEKKLNEAYVVIKARKVTNSSVGVVSSMRKAGRLEKELAEVDRDIEGLEQYVHQLASSAANNKRSNWSVSGGSTAAPPADCTSATAGDISHSMVEV